MTLSYPFKQAQNFACRLAVEHGNITSVKQKERTLSQVKTQILEVLAHPEAEEGLYFRNFQNLDEVDERDPIYATQEQLLDALRELLEEKRITMSGGQDEPIFQLISKRRQAASRQP